MKYIAEKKLTFNNLICHLPLPEKQYTFLALTKESSSKTILGG